MNVFMKDLEVDLCKSVRNVRVDWETKICYITLMNNLVLEIGPNIEPKARKRRDDEILMDLVKASDGVMV